jgi:hypothetical protein
MVQHKLQIIFFHVIIIIIWKLPRHVMKSTLTSETLLINDCIDRVVMKYMYAAAQGEYIGVHRWVFSDEWFLELMEALHSLGVLPD